jgi:hypothetical protein
MRNAWKGEIIVYVDEIAVSHLVAGARDDLPVVQGEGDREDVLGVANEAAGGGARVEIPKAEGSVPGARKGELAVGGHDDILFRAWTTDKLLFLHNAAISITESAGCFRTAEWFAFTSEKRSLQK